MKTTGWLTLLLALGCISFGGRAVGATVAFGSGANTFNVDFVDIGNPGNAADATGSPNPAGSVAYRYDIGKYEISEDMINKANTVGGLFLTKDNRGADKPATNLTWNEAARFVNWLNTSSGYPPAYKFALNPGDAGYTANAQANQNIVQWAPGDGAAHNPNNLYRNSLALYWLPSVDEWYKSAYYDPTNGAYYDYATGSDTAPTFVDNGTAPGTAVYARSFNQGPADIMDAGGLSPYGTMAQSGNVFEWQETDFNLVNGPVTDFRGWRGGYWSSISSHLLSTNWFSSAPNASENVRGFRVATSIPEPSAAMLIATASLGLFWQRRTR